MRPTKTQIKKQIENLKKIKPRVRRTSFFGDDHWAAIEAQITVLERGTSTDEIDETFDTMNVHDAACDARKWLDGEELDEGADLVDGWKELIVK
jgi:hypothetical protein